MIWNELKKVVRRPVVCGIFLLTIIMNMVMLAAVSRESFSPQSYRTLWDNFGQTEGCLQDALQDKWEDEQEQNFLTGQAERELYNRYEKEQEHLTSYEEYRQNILQDAEKMQNFPVFAKNMFARENIRKTAEHFRRMPQVEVKPDPSLGVEKFFSRITAVFSLIFMFLVGYFLFIREKENELMVLLSITKRGKRPLCFSKLAAHMIAVAFHAMFLYAGNYFVLGYQYGFGDLGRSIQSVLAYRSCGFTFSVGSFLVAGVVLAVLILMALALLLDLFCICCGSLIYSAIGILLAAGLSVLAYAGLALNSSAGWLKYISPAFCLDVGEILGKYVNIEFMGNAVYYPYAIASVYGMLAVASFCLSCFLYGRTRDYERINFKYGKAKKRQKKIRMSVFLFEWKKICKNSHAGFLFLLFLILSISISYKERLIFDDEDEYYYYSYMKQVSGERTEEKTQFLEQTKQDFTNLKKKKDELLQMGGQEEQNMEMLEELNRKLRPYNGFMKLVKRESYLEQNRLSAYVYDTGFKNLVSFRDNKENRLLIWLSMLMLILLLSSVFAADREQGFETLLNLTAQKAKMKRSKIVISMLLAFLAFAVLHCPQFVAFLRLYGTSGFTESIACIKMTSVFGSRVPVWFWLAWHYLKILVWMLLVGCGILVLSARLKRVISVMVILLIWLAGAGLIIL